MIDYSPLIKTLKKKDVSIYKLQGLIRNWNLRVILNSGRYIDLKTVDRICKVLKCNVEDVMCWKEGEQKITEIVRKRHYVLRWDLIELWMKERNMNRTELSADMGKGVNFVGHQFVRKWVTWKTMRVFCDYFEKTPEEICE